MKKIFSKLSAFISRHSRLRLFILMLVIFVVFSVLTVILTQSDQVTTDPVGWEKFRTYSPAGVECRNVNVDRNGNTAAIVYEGTSRGKKGIYVNISFDAGMTFLPAQKIAEFTSQINNAPCVAISDTGEIHVAWYMISDDESSGSIFHSWSGDLGVTWTEPKRVTFGLQMEILPVLKYDNRNNLHMFFTAYRGRVFNLYHATKGSDGVFENPSTVAKLASDIKGAFFPAVKFTGSMAVAVWQAKEENYSDSLYLAVSDDYGKSWSGGDRITQPGSNYQAPSLEIVDGVIYLAFMNNRDKNWGIKMMKSSDWGETWDSSPLAISATNSNCFSPDISAGPGNELFIIWHDTREKGNRIFLRSYSISTRELSSETGLSIRNRTGRNAAVLNMSKRLVVFWEEAGSIVSMFSDIYVSAPVVRSRTHSQDSWTKNTDAVVEWDKPKDESGIAGYATVTDRNPDTNPIIQNLRYDANRSYINGLEDGITYFHIRTVDGAGNMSRTVHYRLQVSSNPLAMPVVISTTHPENGKSVSSDAVFRWAINDTRRLKGFVYSLSKDVAVRPDKFIDDFEAQFNSLEKGVYYFNIAAISKTNQMSRVTTYCFIVGTEGEFDPDYLKEIANKDYETKEAAKVSGLGPMVEVTLPLGAGGVMETGDFNAVIIVRNLPKDRIHGFSAVISSLKKEAPEKINLKSNILSVKDLSSGDYTLSIKCRYEKYLEGRRVIAWTEPVYADFSVRIRGKLSPADELYLAIMKKLREHPFTLAAFMLLFTVAVAYAGYGDRIVYFYKLIDHRIRYFF